MQKLLIALTTAWISPRRFTALSLVAACVLALPLQGAELKLDFGQFTLGESPKGFTNLLAGSGRPGEWKIIEAEVPSAIPSLTPNAPTPKQKVLAQTSRDTTDERFPILLYEAEDFADFNLTVRFRIVGGGVEQMAGVVFRTLDERNFYVLRASALDGNIRFYEVVNGNRGALVGPKIEITREKWHQLGIVAKGNQFSFTFDGKEFMPPVSNNSFVHGKIGFWTKSDSVAQFVDPIITYVPREPLARRIVREIMTRYPRIKGLKIYGTTPQRSELHLVASKDEEELGVPAAEIEKNVVAKNSIYCGRGKGTYTVTMPMHDRNGDAVAAVRVTLESFIGPTEQNAINRALPIIKEMELRFRAAKDLYEAQ